MVSIYDHAAGQEALHRFIDIFYTNVLADPLLIPAAAPLGTEDPP